MQVVRIERSTVKAMAILHTVEMSDHEIRPYSRISFTKSVKKVHLIRRLGHTSTAVAKMERNMPK